MEHNGFNGKPMVYDGKQWFIMETMVYNGKPWFIMAKQLFVMVNNGL